MFVIWHIKGQDVYLCYTDFPQVYLRYLSSNLPDKWNLTFCGTVFLLTVEMVLENIAIVSAITPYHLVRHLTAPITLADSIKTTAMVNLGTMGNFIHLRIIEEHSLVTRNWNPLTVNNVNSWLLLHVDWQVEIWTAVRNHSETLTFDVALLGRHNIVLGLPWLQQHDPQIHWSSGKVTFTSDYCEKHCLAQPASTFLNQWPLLWLAETVGEEPDPELDPILTEEVELFAIDIPDHLIPVTSLVFSLNVYAL